MADQPARTATARAGGLDRKLPQSPEAEQYVLGAILIDPDVAPGLLQLLTPADFYATRHQKIFQAIQEIYDELATLDAVMVHDRLRKHGVADAVGGLDYLEEVMLSVSTVANAEFHARTVRERSVLRHLITHCTEIIQHAYDSDQPASAQLDEAEKTILEISNRGEGGDFIDIGTVIDAHFERLERQQGQFEGLSTGFHDLDQATTGLHPAEFVVVAGRPSMGKTTFAMNVVANVASAGHAVAIFSLEVSRDQLVQNLLCSFSQVDAQRFRTNELSNEDWQNLVEGAHRLRELDVFVDDTSSLTPLGLKARARRLHSRKPFQLMVLDYLQLMEGGGSSESRQQEVSSISRSLKAIARELSIPVIAISQLSRGVENRESHRPRLSDLRESGAIEQDADLVLLLYREEYYKPEKEEARGKAEVIIAKQRNGPTGAVHLAFRSRFMRFDNLATRDEYT